MIEQIIGWIGNFGFIVGAILLAKKAKFGFIIQVIANLLYIFQSMLMNNYSLLWLSFILIIINLIGYYKWSKGDRNV